MPTSAAIAPGASPSPTPTGGGDGAQGTQAPQPTGATGATTTAVLHVSVTVTGSLSVTGSFDEPLPVGVTTCTDVGANGTGERLTGYLPSFNVPEPPPSSTGATDGSIGGGHTFGTDASVTAGSASDYPGPGTYSGTDVTATQIDVDRPAGSEEAGIFAPITDPNVGTIVVNADGSGSYVFAQWEDPDSRIISGQVTWTCTDAGH